MEDDSSPFNTFGKGFKRIFGKGRWTAGEDLTEQEINDVNAFSEDTLECDKYLIYMACRELQEEADSLVKAGVIDQHYKIANMFKYADRRAIAEEIFTLSGINDKCTIKPVDEIEEAKN